MDIQTVFMDPINPKLLAFSSLQDGAITAHPRRAHLMAGRPVLLVDDVMTSGATLQAAALACLAVGAGPICIVTLARVAKDT